MCWIGRGNATPWRIAAAPGAGYQPGGAKRSRPGAPTRRRPVPGDGQYRPLATVGSICIGTGSGSVRLHPERPPCLLRLDRPIAEHGADMGQLLAGDCPRANSAAASMSARQPCIRECAASKARQIATNNADKPDRPAAHTPANSQSGRCDGRLEELKGAGADENPHPRRTRPPGRCAGRYRARAGRRGAGKRRG